MIRVEGVGKSFGSTVALREASLHAEPGKITALMGRNGSGKTTLLGITAGAIRPDSGVIQIGEERRGRWSVAEAARRGVMYLPEARLVAPAYTVRAHFEALQAVFPDTDEASAVEVTGIGHLLGQRCVELSGGERARVSLALSLARRPDVLLADEPLRGLTPIDQEHIGQRLRDLAAGGAAVVASGHDVSVLTRICDVIVWCVQGETHHLGDRDAALSHERFRQEYLGPTWRP